MSSALITGVTSGIGLALARALLAKGYSVHGVGRDAAKLAALKSELGSEFTPHTCDLSDANARTRWCASLHRPRLEVLVNNAGVCTYDTLSELPATALASMLETNVLAAMQLCQTLLPALQASGRGHVVNVSSVTARFVASSRFSAYGMTKTALERLTEGLRLDAAPLGIKVSSIAPGLVDTPIYDKVQGFAQTKDKLRQQVPEWLSASDVASAIVWMLEAPRHVVVADMTLLPLGQSR